MAGLRGLVLLAAIGPASASCASEGARGRWGWDARPWSWWSAPKPGCEARPTEGRRSTALSGPVVVKLGPVMDANLNPRGFYAFPVEELVSLRPFSLDLFDGFHQDMHGLLEGLKRRWGQVVHGGGFKVEAKDGHFKLWASLPGYRMLCGDGEERPLSVKVVGQALVIRGRKATGHMISSFQRSFHLPSRADAGRIAVTYNNTSGSLAVDIPAKAGVQELDDSDRANLWMFDSQDGGSHTTISFPSGLVKQALPALRGSFPSLMEDLTGLVRKTVDFSESLADPAAQIWKEAAQVVGATDDAGQTAKQAPQFPELVDKPALVVQPRNARPFWRLGDAAQGAMATIEIVAPEGVDVGKPVGHRVPVFNGTAEKRRGARQPIAQVELPVTVTDETCTWAAAASPQERVLQCRIEKGEVKDVQIDVTEEL